MNIQMIRAMKKMIRPVLAFTIASIVPLYSLALADLTKKTSPISGATEPYGYQTQEPAGTIVASGEIMVNGNEVPSGATVFSKSTIETGRASSAVVDLGPIGRIDLGPGTNVLLTFSDELITVAPACHRLTVRVIQGSVEARSATGPRPLRGGKEDVLVGASVLVAQKGSILFLDCSPTNGSGGGGSGPPISGPMIGVFSAVGVAGAIAAGVAIRGGSERSSRVSPTVP